MAHIGLVPEADPETLKRTVDRLIADKAGRFHFGSLIRCTVEQYTRKGHSPGWAGTGGNMLDKFVATPFGQEVAENCATRFLANLPPETRLVVLFGLGTGGNYLREAPKVIQRARPGMWRTINEVAYTDGKVTFVHVEHFAVQGAHLSNWLGKKPNDRARLGVAAREAVRQAVVPAS